MLESLDLNPILAPGSEAFPHGFALEIDASTDTHLKNELTEALERLLLTPTRNNILDQWVHRYGVVAIKGIGELVLKQYKERKNFVQFLEGPSSYRGQTLHFDDPRQVDGPNIVGFFTEPAPSKIRKVKTIFVEAVKGVDYFQKSFHGLIQELLLISELQGNSDLALLQTLNHELHLIPPHDRDAIYPILIGIRKRMRLLTEKCSHVEEPLHHWMVNLIEDFASYSVPHIVHTYSNDDLVLCDDVRVLHGRLGAPYDGDAGGLGVFSITKRYSS